MISHLFHLNGLSLTSVVTVCSCKRKWKQTVRVALIQGSAELLGLRLAGWECWSALDLFIHFANILDVLEKVSMRQSLYSFPVRICDTCN